jgi:hypothetical protein
MLARRLFMEFLPLGQSVESFAIVPRRPAVILFRNRDQEEVVLSQKLVEYLVTSYFFSEKPQLKFIQSVMLDNSDSAPVRAKFVPVNVSAFSAEENAISDAHMVCEVIHTINAVLVEGVFLNELYQH